jgi:hypothetical protein
MRRVLILLVLLFAIGVGVFGPAQAQVDDRRRPCLERCRQELRDARDRCRNLPPNDRRECLRRAQERFEACVRHCR